MSGQELIIQQQGALQPQLATNLTDVQRLGGILAASGYFSDAREMAQAAVKVMAGQELGIPPVAAMMGINIIKGKVALGGNLIASRIRAHGYEYRHKQFDAHGCVLTFWSKPDKEGKRELLGESSFTEEDAKSAGVYGEMYKKYPRNMYFNRAISNGAKWYTPDVFGGAPVYTPEELGARVDSEGDVIHEKPQVQPEPFDPAAYEEVRTRKIAEAEEYNRNLAASRKPVEEAVRTGEAYRTEAKPQPQRIDDVPPAVAKLWAEMGTTISGVCKTFERLKGELVAYSGSEEEYYTILNRHGFQHANDVKNLGMQKARACARELHEAAEAWRRQNEPPADSMLITEEDIQAAVANGK
jgi:hypothetical protein